MQTDLIDEEPLTITSSGVSGIVHLILVNVGDVLVQLLVDELCLLQALLVLIYLTNYNVDNIG